MKRISGAPRPEPDPNARVMIIFRKGETRYETVCKYLMIHDELSSKSIKNKTPGQDEARNDDKTS